MSDRRMDSPMDDQPIPGRGGGPQFSADGELTDGHADDPEQADRARDDERARRRGQRAAMLADVEPRPGVPKPDAVLVADRVRRSFGGLVAVDVEHLEVQRGTITALIGPNGAGKTTFFNLLSNFDSPDRGTRTFDGEVIGRAAPHRVAEMGMVRTFQLTKALTRLTVLENMKLGAATQPGEGLVGAFRTGRWRDEEESITRRADELLERFQLAHMRDQYAGTLSGGQRKLLEMARSLMVEPSLVMLDEPMAGVNPALTQRLLHHVTSLPDHGMTVLFVEHDMDVVMDISDWVVVLAEGRVIAEGPPEAVATDPTVIDAYLGAHHEDKSAYELGPAERVRRSQQGQEAA